MATRKCSYLDWPRIDSIFSHELSVVTPEERSYMVRSLFEGTWVWEENSVITGFAMLNDEKFPEIGWLEYIAIDTPWKGLGIGSMLLHHCEEIARSEQKEWFALSTFDTNEEAIRFYLGKGYHAHPDSKSGKHIFFRSLTNDGRDLPEFVPIQRTNSRFTMGYRRMIYDVVVSL